MDKQISKLKTYLFIIGFALVVQLIFSVLYFRHSNLLHSSSLTNIDSLISEIGDIKNENLLLDHQLKSQNLITEQNYQFLEQINEKISSKMIADATIKTELIKYQEHLEKEKSLLSTKNLELNNLLNINQAEILALQEQKTLQAEIQQIDKDIIVFLLLGQNQKLTDTIILVFVNEKKQKSTLVSIPRDLFFEGRKINEFLNLYGPLKLKAVLSEITGFKIDKYTQIDFEAFTDIIDMLGGITIQIDKKIIDKSYPASGNGYKTVTFEPGIEKLNGKRALEYARSRKSTSDFDRSLRQQKIVAAIKEKLMQNSPLDNVNFYLTLFQKIQHNLQTDLNVFEALQYFDVYKDYQFFAGNILSNENFLYSSRSTTGQSILLPNNASYEDFQKKLLEII